MTEDAFGSLVVFHSVGHADIVTENGSVGERLARVVRVRLFEDEDSRPTTEVPQSTTRMVQLLGENGEVVGVGVEDTSFTCGIELHQVKLRPFEIVVRITHVVDERQWVGELVGKYLGDCMEKVIRWRRSSVRWAHPSEVRSTTTSSRDGGTFSFPPIRTPEFDFHDTNENPSSSNRTGGSCGERSTTGRSSSRTHGSEGSTHEIAGVDGMYIRV